MKEKVISIEQAKQAIDAAWEALRMDNDPKAIERTIAAVAWLIKCVEEEQQLSQRTADIASCLANGIKPD